MLLNIVIIGGTKTPFAGAWTSLNAAVNPELKGTRDVYFADSKPETTSSLARYKSHLFQQQVQNYLMLYSNWYMTRLMKEYH